MFFSKRMGLNLHYFHSSRVFAEWIPLSLLLSIHSISLLCLLKIRKIGTPLSWHWHVEASRRELVKSTFIVVTSRVGSSFSASIIEELKYLLKALLSIFFKLAFVVRSNGWNRCVIFFGTITDSIPCFYRTSDTLAVDWALEVSHIKGDIFDLLVDLFLP